VRDIASKIRWIRSVLIAQPALAGVAVEVSPSENAPRAVTIRHQGGYPMAAQPQDRIGQVDRFSVLLSWPSNSLTPEIIAMAAAFDALEAPASRGSNADGVVWACHRAQPIYYAQRGEDGRTWQYAGGVYEITGRGA
jgi:hypothetical protein